MSHNLGLLKICLSQPMGRGCDVGYRFLSGGTKALDHMSGSSYVLLYSHLNCGNQPNVYTQKVLLKLKCPQILTFPQKVSANKPLVLYNTLHNSHKNLLRKCWLANKSPHYYTKVMSWGGGIEYKPKRGAESWLRTALPHLHGTVYSDHLSCSNTLNI